MLALHVWGNQCPCIQSWGGATRPASKQQVLCCRIWTGHGRIPWQTLRPGTWQI